MVRGTLIIGESWGGRCASNEGAEEEDTIKAKGKGIFPDPKERERVSEFLMALGKGSPDGASTEKEGGADQP